MAMDKEFLGDRKKALEESFFDRENRRLLEEMRSKEQSAANQAGLAEISGIQDEAILAKLVDIGIGPESWAAISLVPLVEVAWADGHLDEREVRAVLSAAEANGVTVGSPSYKLLESWLAERPVARLLEAWGEYTVAVCGALDDGQREALRREILGRARAVAEAAGGILGLVNKISPKEQAVLDQLEKAFAA